ncbi:MAG: hypothetical protein QM767_28045 [Anaeromyxobacter sp.]
MTAFNSGAIGAAANSSSRINFPFCENSEAARSLGLGGGQTTHQKDRRDKANAAHDNLL